MGFNPVHYRKTWESIGKPFDPPAVQRLEAPWSAISLLKAITGAVGGIIPPGAVGTDQLAEHSVTFPKIRLVAGFSLVGRALPFSGEVHEVFLDQNGIVFDGVSKLQLAPAVGDVTAPLGTRTFTLAEQRGRRQQRQAVLDRSDHEGGDRHAEQALGHDRIWRYFPVVERHRHIVSE